MCIIYKGEAEKWFEMIDFQKKSEVNEGELVICRDTISFKWTPQNTKFKFKGHRGKAVRSV